MAVTISNEIHFFKNDIEVRYVTAANISELYALAYDSANRTLYVNGENQTNSHYSNVYYSDLAEEDLNLQPTLDGKYAYKKEITICKRTKLFIERSKITGFWKNWTYKGDLHSSRYTTDL